MVEKLNISCICRTEIDQVVVKYPLKLSSYQSGNQCKVKGSLYIPEFKPKYVYIQLHTYPYGCTYPPTHKYTCTYLSKQVKWSHDDIILF